MRAPTIVTLLFALGAPPALAIVGRWTVGDSPSIAGQMAFQIGLWAILAVVLFVVLRVEKQPLRSIGLRRPDRWTFVAGALVAAGMLHLLPAVAGWFMRDVPNMERSMSQLRALPVGARLFMAVTAATVEETLYRGYAVERLGALVGNYWLGGVIAASAFGIAHVPSWGRYAVVDLLFGLVATALYLWRRDLVANIIAHVTGLTVALLRLGGTT